MAEDKETALSPGGSELKDRIMYSLMENQMILPGVQLLIGFQIGSMITKDFAQLPLASRVTSLASLALLLVTMLLLMMPAAFHRYVERGESTVRFERFSQRVLKWSMLPFALGLCGNFYVVLQKVSASVLWGSVGALVTLVASLAMWYGYPIVRGRIVNAQREQPQT